MRIKSIFVLLALALSLAINAVAATRYVDVNNATPVSPYTNWATAATDIQSAVDAATAGDEIRVTNGVYRAGSHIVSGAVTVTNSLAVQSVNGPAATVINAEGLRRCVYLGNGSLLAGFTLTNGNVSGQGGGCLCEPEGVLSNCVVVGNSAYDGGGTTRGTLINCTLVGNSASSWAGGSLYGTLINCAVTGNSAYNGGGTYSCTLTNCTLVGNSAVDNGGGSYLSTLRNCIVYFNSDAATSLLGEPGPGNVGEDPQLASLSHLSASSPCRNAGNAAYTSGVDIDGEPWQDPPSVGCDQFISGSVTGALEVLIDASHTNVAVGAEIRFTAWINGRVNASQWEFDDGTIVSNRPIVGHRGTVPGSYPVVLRAFNETYPAGVTSTTVVHIADPPVHYVRTTNPGRAFPYHSWATAATNIQEAVDAVAVPGSIILVSNGVYETGARYYRSLTNRVVVTNQVIVRSLNGPASVTITGSGPVGYRAVRGVYLANGAMLDGFTVTNGATEMESGGVPFATDSGGAVFCESPANIVTNCVITGNAGGAGALFGGTVHRCLIVSNAAAGAAGSTLNHCLVMGNSGLGVLGGALYNCLVISNYSGGASEAILNNCTVVGNTASGQVGGASGGRLTNCIVYYNSGNNYGGISFPAELSYCCTTPYPTAPYGARNFTVAPVFVDLAGGDLHLQSNSPCINAGFNTGALSTDFDGNPRVTGGTVDVGAYEFPSPASMLSYAWAQAYGLPTDGSVDFVDTDGDHLNNWEEWRAWTIPTNAASVLQLLTPSNSGSGVSVRWDSVRNVMYFLERSTNLAVQPAFSSLASNLVGQANTTTYTDTTAAGSGPFFYRVGVQ
jgi:hypothetical protein